MLICFLQVQYVRNIGGFNVKEAVNQALKECVTDTLTLSYTWWGHKQHKSFCDTKIVMVIFGTIFYIFIFIFIYLMIINNASCVCFQMLCARISILRNQVNTNLKPICKKLYVQLRKGFAASHVHRVRKAEKKTYIVTFGLMGPKKTNRKTRRTKIKCPILYAETMKCIKYISLH